MSKMKCQVEVPFYTANKIIIATTNANNAIDSNNAKYNIPDEDKFADGFLTNSAFVREFCKFDLNFLVDLV